MRTVDYIREDMETIDSEAFWKLVSLAIRAGRVDGFTPSPRQQMEAEEEIAARIRVSVMDAIERGRRAAGV